MKLGQLITALQSVEGLEIKMIESEEDGCYDVSLSFIEIHDEEQQQEQPARQPGEIRDYIVP